MNGLNEVIDSLKHEGIDDILIDDRFKKNAKKMRLGETWFLVGGKRRYAFIRITDTDKR